MACIVLHNIANERRLPVLDKELPADDNVVNVEEAPRHSVTGKATRDAIVQRYFNHYGKTIIRSSVNKM